jgi:hypothetical protein
MDPDDVRTSPEEQRAQGLTPDEQREQREEESRETDETKYEQLREGERDARDELADLIGNGDET